MKRSGNIFIIGAAAALLVSGVLLSQARRPGAQPDQSPAATQPAPAPLADRAMSPAERARAATTTRLAMADAPTIRVYKTPTCGCCTSWIEHLQEHGFEVEAQDMPNLNPVKARLGITRDLASCHTAEVDGYIIEGHVPADLIERVLVERPEIAGLAVPGMPMGSPGMEGHYSENYDILAFWANGEREVFARR